MYAPCVSIIIRMSTSVYDRLHEYLFDVSEQCKNDIHRLRGNDPSLATFSLASRDNFALTETSRNALGYYIARNDQLKNIDLSDSDANEEDLSALFSEMKVGKSVKFST